MSSESQQKKIHTIRIDLESSNIKSSIGLKERLIIEERQALRDLKLSHPPRTENLNYEIILKHSGLNDCLMPTLNKFLIGKNFSLLDLFSNSITDRGVEILMPALLENDIRLYLGLGFNQITFASVLMLRRLAQLDKVYLFGNKLLEGKVTQVKQNDLPLGWLNVLGMSRTSIKDEGMITVSKIIEASPNLEELYLRENQLTAKSLVLLSGALHYAKKLTHLYLAHNQFTNGLYRMQKAFASTKHITVLNLIECGLSEGDVHVLAECVREVNFRDLKKLFLKKNDISRAQDDDLKVIISMPSLSELLLDECGLGAHHSTVIAEAVNNRARVPSFTMSGSAFSRKSSNHLFKLSLQKNDFSILCMDLFYQLQQTHFLLILALSPLNDGAYDIPSKVEALNERNQEIIQEPSPITRLNFFIQSFSIDATAMPQTDINGHRNIPPVDVNIPSLSELSLVTAIGFYRQKLDSQDVERVESGKQDADDDHNNDIFQALQRLEYHSLPELFSKKPKQLRPHRSHSKLPLDEQHEATLAQRRIHNKAKIPTIARGMI